MQGQSWKRSDHSSSKAFEIICNFLQRNVQRVLDKAEVLKFTGDPKKLVLDWIESKDKVVDQEDLLF